MNIQSISIVPEDVGCNAQCKYCIAAITPPVSKSVVIDLSKLYDALIYARAGGAQSAIVTSKGETLLTSWEFIGNILNLCRQTGYGHRDLHTNASLIALNKEKFYSSIINIEGRLTNITITAASLDPDVNYELMGVRYDTAQLFRFLSEECGLVIRLSCILNKKAVKDKKSLLEYAAQAKSLGVRQIVFRELWIPEVVNQNQQGIDIMKWSLENKVDMSIAMDILKDLSAEGKAHPIFTLPCGQVVYDLDGLNTVCATCTENFWESDKGSIKSVVFLPDNHLYSSWEFTGSIIL